MIQPKSYHISFVASRILFVLLLSFLLNPLALEVASAAPPDAPTFSVSTLQLLVDNDYAAFYGDATNVNQLFYQNNYGWPKQVENSASLDIIGSDTQTYVYIVAMGGGGTEDIGGKLNLKNITTISGAQFAQTDTHTSTFGSGSKLNRYLEIQDSLTAYDASAAAAGTYNVQLVDLQNALRGADWGSAVATGSGDGVPPLYKSSGICCTKGLVTEGWDIPSNKAVVFRYPIASLGTPVTPGNKQVTVSWGNPSGGGTPDTYVVQYKKTSDPDSAFATFSTPSYGVNTETVTALTNGVNYSFRVAARNSDGTSAYTPVRTATPTGPPEAPTSLSATVASGSTTISFTAPTSNGGSAITNYQYSINDGSTWTAFSPTVVTSPVTISGLTNATTYPIRLRAINALGNGDSSTAISVTPGVPFTITYNSQGGSAISGDSTTTGASISTSPGTPTRSGYSFNGWFVTASGGSAITFPYAHGQTSNFTLYAQWIGNTLTITNDSQGGSSISSGTTTTGSTVATSPGTPTRSGYAFNGWFVASSGGSAITFPYTHNQTANFT